MDGYLTDSVTYGVDQQGKRKKEERSSGMQEKAKANMMLEVGMGRGRLRVGREGGWKRSRMRNAERLSERELRGSEEEWI